MWRNGSRTITITRWAAETRKMADDRLSVWLRGSRGLLGVAYLTLIRCRNAPGAEIGTVRGSPGPLLFGGDLPAPLRVPASGPA
jgi:hypothetical protein